MVSLDLRAIPPDHVRLGRRAGCRSRRTRSLHLLGAGWASQQSVGYQRSTVGTRASDASPVSDVLSPQWLNGGRQIEVLHGEFSAFRWQEQHDSALIEAALTNGAVDGSWHADRWGVAFEICFENEERWETFRSLPAVRAALDGVPDPVSGLLVYRGRGGGAGAREPRKPKLSPSASAVSQPEPQAVPHLDLTGISPLDPVRAGTAAGSGL